jgi:hypothetical protein
MNPSEEVTEMAELHLPLGDYCFAYVNEDITVQVSTRGAEPVALVSAFVSYMKALQFDSKAIESALYKTANTMKSFRVLGSILKSKE